MKARETISPDEFRRRTALLVEIKFLLCVLLALGVLGLFALTIH